ncbi:unnamed protein product [Mesocestoides corti]|uniref:Uncharacterized protein n=1 Tax=Mesocestoides corti TaxID=53468 RepID=A0A0R3URV1_MESCO|nr:unnamed protein product [Mesocestoides corti]
MQLAATTIISDMFIVSMNTSSCMFFNQCIRPSNRSSSDRFQDSHHQQLLLLCHLAASSKHIPLLRRSSRLCNAPLVHDVTLMCYPSAYSSGEIAGVRLNATLVQSLLTHYRPSRWADLPGGLQAMEPLKEAHMITLRHLLSCEQSSWHVSGFSCPMVTLSLQVQTSNRHRMCRELDTYPR